MSRSHATLRRMYVDGHIEGIELDLNSKPEFCETCVKAKAKRKPFPKQGQYEYVENTGDKVVGDLMGPMSVVSLGGARYAFGSYKRYEIWIKVQRGVEVIKILGTDRGGEFST